ncbi:dolichyl pyrophosphate Glc1Man9GlcNAc2 alpha-1,3-glucosyltransferase-like isoform X2 [Branchiostoma floridae x Branchiostoma belcheri]
MAAPMYFSVVVTVTIVKLLLIPSYRSTDFEVHRNWLAITHSRPVSQWYYEDTSEWTLDYPPMFAWFEFLLSRIAKLFDPAMLEVTNLNYASFATVLFQRLSVIVSDFLLVYAVYECCQCVQLVGKKKSPHLLSQPMFVLAVLLLWNFGLLIVDHIHFQYNGFLTGLKLLSIARILERRHLEGAFWFSLLLNFKHIYLYIAPAYFIYLLRSYCFTRSNRDGRVQWTSLSLMNLFGLGVVVLEVFAISFGPFIAMGQLGQVLSRLFPVKRGLVHAYWAPNFWALYNIADKAATAVAVRAKILSADDITKATMTGGLVQEYTHNALPTITPLVTVILTLAAMMPALVHLWRRPCTPRDFLRCLVLCAFSSFLFGYHVHEKAIILIIIPLSLLAVESRQDGQVFLLLSTCGHLSLFPLLFTQAETPSKVCLMLMFSLFAFMSLGVLHSSSKKRPYCLPLLSPLETAYTVGLVFLQLYCSLGHHALGLTTRLPFLPLMLTSVYCAVGVMWSWLKFYLITLTDMQHLKQS